MTDTHAHLYFKNFDPDRDKVIERCRDKLAAVINIGVDFETSKQSVELAKNNEFMWAAVGVHPEKIRELDIKDQNLGNDNRDLKNEISALTTLLDQPNCKIVAIGEIGLDYLDLANSPYSSDQIKKFQQELFRTQLELALKHNLPIIIHSRKAFEETIKVLTEYKNQPNFRGVWHCFTEGIDAARQVLDLGFYIGLNGILTYPSAKDLQEAVAKFIPIDKILLETDAPFLGPAPDRPKRCEPWMVEVVGKKLAKLKNLKSKTVADITDENTAKIFNVRQS